MRLWYLNMSMGGTSERKEGEGAMPALAGFSRGSCSMNEEMKAVYQDYATAVSTDDMAISYESACLLWSLCETIKPRRILDMGSGFSSFVFRRYQATADPRPEVWSVDEHPDWLEKTKGFLNSRGLSVDNLFSWEEFQVLQPPTFDLISHDLGLMEDRPGIFERMLHWREPEGLIVIDDIQKPAYREEILQKIRQNDEIEGYTLRWLTFDRHLRYGMLVQRNTSRQQP